jgi:methionine-rich copper-binding protein CopC
MKPARNSCLAMLLVASAMAGHAPAWAHASLQSAHPAKDSVVAAPTEITLQFNERLESAFSGARVVDGAGKEVSNGKGTLDKSNPSIMKIAVPALAAGRYTVEYVGVGHDGHRRKGEYSFTVK